MPTADRAWSKYGGGGSKEVADTRSLNGYGWRSAAQGPPQRVPSYAALIAMEATIVARESHSR